MTAYNDIRDAVMTLITTAKPEVNIYGEEIQQGFKRPAFYVQLTPERGTTLNKAHWEKAILVEIAYFSPDHLAQQNRDLWGMADSLEKLLGNTLAVGDRVFTLNDPTPEIVDRVLHYTFTLEFTDSRDDAFIVELDPGVVPPGQVLPMQIILPEPELDYVDGKVVPMRELVVKEEV